MDMLLQQEVAEAGIRLRKAISRVVNETPECFTHKNGKWSVEFRNPATIHPTKSVNRVQPN